MILIENDNINVNKSVYKHGYEFNENWIQE